jgi:hypothetical protein
MNKLMKMAIGPFVAVALGASLVACTGEDPGDEPSAVDSTTPTDIETTSGETPAAVEEDPCEQDADLVWAAPAWCGDASGYAQDVLQLMQDAVGDSGIVITLVDESGETYDLLLGTVDFDVQSIADGVTDDCGWTSMDGVYSTWCSAGNYVSVYDTNVANAMPQSEIDVVGSLLYDYARVLLEGNLVEEDDYARNCVAGAVVGTLNAHDVWVDEREAIRDTIFSDGAVDFDFGADNYVC